MDMIDLGHRAAERIEKLSAKLREISPCEASFDLQYQFSALTLEGRNLAVDALKERLRGCQLSIYSFHLDERADRSLFLQTFDNAKKSKLDKLAYPRLNKELDRLSADCLYVGTSRKTAKRISEHLGFGDDRTYSMQLAKWASTLEGGLKIRIHPFALDTTQLPLLTYLEDALAEDLKPILGRRGNL